MRRPPPHRRGGCTEYTALCGHAGFVREHLVGWVQKRAVITACLRCESPIPGSSAAPQRPSGKLAGLCSSGAGAGPALRACRCMHVQAPRKRRRHNRIAHELLPPLSEAPREDPRRGRPAAGSTAIAWCEQQSMVWPPAALVSGSAPWPVARSACLCGAPAPSSQAPTCQCRCGYRHHTHASHAHAATSILASPGVWTSVHIRQ